MCLRQEGAYGEKKNEPPGEAIPGQEENQHRSVQVGYPGGVGLLRKGRIKAQAVATRGARERLCLWPRSLQRELHATVLQAGPGQSLALGTVRPEGPALHELQNL